jgi:ATP-dependent RNA helicase DDX24/MAK5
MLDKLMENIEFHRKVEVIDLTSELIVASKLDEARIFCLPEEKDYYLYYFLEKYKGRTLIFVNAITNIKRIVPLLQMLRIQVWPMHAAMQQRQRLKNLGMCPRPPGLCAGLMLFQNKGGNGKCD